MNWGNERNWGAEYNKATGMVYPARTWWIVDLNTPDHLAIGCTRNKETARLMAAAPDLLEALGNVTARAAIAKAEGR